MVISFDLLAVFGKFFSSLYIDGATIYTTLQPCFGCLKESLQAGISTIKFLNPWEHPDRRLKRTYDSLQKKFSGGLYKINIDEKEIRRLENF